MSKFNIVGVEDHIIKGCINKQRDCQKKLYDALAGKMLFVCFRYCKNRDDAEDVLQ
jgi:DNA-directed RNA polymerase specialized sigma24 family protein